MSDVSVMTTASGCHIFSGCGYPAPSISDFYFKPIFTVGGIVISLAIIAAAFPLLAHITGPETARNE